MGGWIRASVPLAVALGSALACLPATAAEPEGAAGFRKNVEPVLNDYCITCHNSRLKKGGVAFDADNPALLLEDKDLWFRTLKMVRAGLMPPRGKDRPTAQEIAQVEQWIKTSAFGIDLRHPDPGRVTLRRLNRTEYRNTIRDLMGVDFNASAEFPADDTGHGFDNLSDVLTLSPLLLEKYIAAARSIVGQVVPTQPLVPAEKRIPGKQFAAAGSKPTEPLDGPLSLSYYKAATVRSSFQLDHAGRYQLILEMTANETYVDGQFDANKCRLLFRVGDKEFLSQEFSRQGGKAYRFEFEQDWQAGPQDMTLEVQPLTPKERQVRSLTLRIVAVTLRGPQAREHWVRPANYERFFPGGVPLDPKERQVYARKLLEAFATRAYRRPVDAATLDRLVRLVEATADKPGQTFEGGISQAMTVILASPRFLYREEGMVANSTDRYPLLDEYALATRMSYFLWSSLPDEELFRLAAENKLRQNLSAQIDRMLADKRAGEFVRNFSGQWLQARNIDNANVNAFAVLAKDQPADPRADEKRARLRELARKPADTLTEAEKKDLEELRATVFSGGRRFAQFQLTTELRRAMRQETEMSFEDIVRNDRSLLELLDADYTFLNERLARFYDIEGVTGEQMRKVSLPANSPRGGILTQGTFLIVTSNPDRTSPVKRGLFILDNILGVPPPPPPPDVATLEQSAAQVKGKPPVLRETLKLHRSDALCASCHNRMDPLGLAFENFNALGRWRDKELNQPIEAGGELLSGEAFKDVRELKRVLVSTRRLDFYRCATEKMLIYALGRGLEAQDTEMVDDLVAKLEAAKGRPSVLIRGIIEAPAFQRRRPITEAEVKRDPRLADATPSW
jgi:mono/diheme cytochrome c family protein